MSQKGKVVKSLAKKLSSKPRAAAAFEEQDIEDIVKGKYFSPVQTRQQRKTNKTQPIKLELPVDNVKGETKSANASASMKKMGVGELKPDLSAISSDITKDIKPLVEPMQWEPKNWRLVLQNIRQMRADTDAPVDSMGCHKCSDDDADEKTQRFQKLVALMLSSQTKDEVTYEAMQRLRSNGLKPEIISNMPSQKLEDLLRPVSFYKNKAKYLQQASRILMEKYESDIPNNIKELVALPGVGPKMAHLCMSTAWGEVTGIGVDVHVHRITNRLHWLPKPTKEPEQTRIALESWLPREMWKEVNHLLVGFGQTVCAAVRPHCAECLNLKICPSADKSAKKKKVKEEETNNEAVLMAKKSKFEKKKLHM